MTDAQKHAVVVFILTNDPSEARHGDCIGADTDFHIILQRYFKTVPIIIHPSNLKTRAWNSGAIKVHDPKDPLDRDHDIADASDIMIATPKGFAEERRSGTWTTVRYSKRTNKKTMIIYPNGEMKEW